MYCMFLLPPCGQTRPLPQATVGHKILIHVISSLQIVYLCQHARAPVCLSPPAWTLTSLRFIDQLTQSEVSAQTSNQPGPAAPAASAGRSATGSIQMTDGEQLQPESLDLVFFKPDTMLRPVYTDIMLHHFWNEPRWAGLTLCDLASLSDSRLCFVTTYFGGWTEDSL